ncbi:MAG: hypothetical protein GDA36_10715 [Rhodobacteraceae bacterium]|nr:hypothetical protein [Paracoccaceae bacterium]
MIFLPGVAVRSGITGRSGVQGSGSAPCYKGFARPDEEGFIDKVDTTPHRPTKRSRYASGLWDS